MDYQVITTEYPSILIAHINSDSPIIPEDFKKKYREGKIIIKEREKSDEEKKQIQERMEEIRRNRMKRYFLGLN